MCSHVVKLPVAHMCFQVALGSDQLILWEQNVDVLDTLIFIFM